MSHHLALSVVGRMNLRGLLLSPHYASLAADLRELAAADPAREAAAWEARKVELAAAYGFGSDPQQQQRKPFVFAEGTAVIPVHGILINRFSASWGFATGYNFIRSQFAAASADPDVEQIVFDVNSPGGMAAGCEEIADEIYAGRDAKPSLSLVDSSGYSAAYWIASAASKLYVAPSAGVGSVGVIAAHISLAGMLDEAGIKVTMIHAGAHKADGNPYEDLSPEVKADIQADVDAIYSTFVSAVARNRGMSDAAVRDTEARTYRAADAVDTGLADAVVSPTRALGAFVAQLDSDMEDIEMAQQGNDAAAAAAAAEQERQAAAASAAAQATAVADARKAERERMAGIMSCDEAKERQALAKHLATATDMSVDAAKAVLGVAAVEAKPDATANAFASAMDKSGGAGVGTDGKDAKGGEAEGGQKASVAASILRDQQQATGRKLINADGTPVKH
jgi:signal peptide peptidase SppA